jgi:acylphosphatase
MPFMADPTEPATVRAKISVTGRVQGVGYRAFVVRVASTRGVCGTVQNLDDGRVELEVEGLKDRIESLLEDLKVGPPASWVSAVNVEWAVATGRFTDFRVRY